ncbi:MAG TPA: DUF3105 domain-containing protein [Solirubrobacterales bacterium]
MTQRRRHRLLVAYASVGLVTLAILCAVLVLSTESVFTARGDSHVNVASGSTNGVPPDSRMGIKSSGFLDLNLRDAARAASCELRLHLPDEGHKHILPSAPEPNYRTKPPASGNHVDQQQADGAYGGTPDPVSVVHSLEHGRMAIQYQPDLPERIQQELLGLYGTMYGGTLLFPNEHMPYVIAAVTWTNILGCSEYGGTVTLEAIRAFGKATWGRYGGEPVAGIDPAAPTPTKPSASH